jgi:PIN domain nuclease of toxin-antitoxin system
MRVLLDTHVLIWALDDMDDALDRKTRALLEHHPTERDHPSDKDARENKG